MCHSFSVDHIYFVLKFQEIDFAFYAQMKRDHLGDKTNM